MATQNIPHLPCIHFFGVITQTINAWIVGMNRDYAINSALAICRVLPQHVPLKYLCVYNYLTMEILYSARTFHQLATPFQTISICMNISLDDKFSFETSQLPALFENLYVLLAIYHKDWRRRHEHMFAVSAQHPNAQHFATGSNSLPRFMFALSHAQYRMNSLLCS